MRAADTTTLGTTDVVVTKLGLGTAPIGGLFTAVTPAEAAATVKSAYDLGIRYFDTAPHYGAGLAESRLGEAMAAASMPPVAISTKVGRSLVPGEQEEQFWAEPNGLRSQFDFSYDATLRSHSQSLARLRRDRVDIGLIHDPDDHYGQAMSGTYPALRHLKESGRLGAIGAGMNQVEMPIQLAEAGEFDVFLIAGRYNLLDTSALPDLLPLCQSRGISLIAAGVFHGGLLADVDNESAATYLPRAPYLDRLRDIKSTCDRHGVPVRAAAIQFPAAHPAVASVIVGVRSVHEVTEAVSMYQYPIPSTLWDDLKRQGLMPEAAPTP